MSSLHEPAVDPSSYADAKDRIRNGTAWASAPTTNPWDPAILALDGGGIRGYSSLLILGELMREISRVERLFSASTPDATSPRFAEANLLPCHYFDSMYGTSTGGLIATMLGRLRMSVPQCLAVYRTVGQALFGKPRSLIPLTTKYHHKPLERAVREIVRQHCREHPRGACDGEDMFPWEGDAGDGLCQSICLAAVHNGRIDEAHMLRTYDHRYAHVPNWIMPYNEGADALRIWQVARATSAAPFYFKMLEAELRGQRWSFKDGGIRENNPAGAAWSEFISLHGEMSSPALLLSLGTGHSSGRQDGFASAWPGAFGRSTLVRAGAEKLAVLRNLLVKYTDGEDRHRSLLATARGEHTWYKRLNVSEGLEALPLDAWVAGPWSVAGSLDDGPGAAAAAAVDEPVVPGGRTLRAMEDATRRYLARPKDVRFDTYAAPGVVVRQVAEKLVRQRRAREAGTAEDGGRWYTYCGRWIGGQWSPEEEVPIEWDVKNTGGRKGSRGSLFSRASQGASR